MLENVAIFIKVTNQAREIANSSISWDTKYDLIFSKEILGKINQCRIPFDWYDPDTSYEDDVRAFINAITEKAQELSQLS